MSGKTVTAKLGDAQLDASAAIGWSLVAGVSPFVQAFTMDKAEAGKIAPRDNVKPSPLTLSVTDGEGKSLEVRSLYAIGEMETIDPNRRTVLVADRRIWWQRKRVVGRFNIRRRSGDRRRLSEDGLPQQIQQIADDVTYAPWSLKDGKPWKPADVARHVLDHLEPGAWDGALDGFQSGVMENLEIDDEGGDGLSRALMYLIGANVYVGLDGLVHVFDSTNVADITSKIKGWRERNPSHVDARWPSLSNRSVLRPSKVRVLLQVEQEVRLDSLTSGETQASADQRMIQNVAPIPDPTLAISGQTRVAGTWATFDQLFPAWTAAKGSNDVPDIDDATLREFYVSGFPEAYWGRLGVLAPTAVWVERIATCRAHYRQTWRINRRWVDRVYQWRPYRVSILDTETGTFARAQAFTGYCVVPATKGLLASAGEQYIAMNVDGSVGINESLENGRVAPCLIDMIDPELGIFRLDYQMDLLGHYRQIIPSLCENVPTCCPTKENNVYPITMDGSVHGEAGVAMTLAETNRVAVVLTAVPAAPNGKAQYRAIEITAADAVALLPAGAQEMAKAATGPPWEIRIGGQIATARYAWSDAKATEIERSMGVGLPVTQSDDDQRAGIDDLLCNRDEINALAKAAAASVYAGLLDHWAGSHTSAMDVSITPSGSIKQVYHSVTTSGVTATTVILAGEQVAYDSMAALPESARRLFLRTVQP